MSETIYDGFEKITRSRFLLRPKPSRRNPTQPNRAKKTPPAADPHATKHWRRPSEP